MPAHHVVTCRATAAAALLLLLGTLAGCGGGATEAVRATPTADDAAIRRAADDPAPKAPRTVPVRRPNELPGLGPRRLAAVPDNAHQAVVVTGEGPDSPVATAVLYERTAVGWQGGPSWPAHNALRGWTDDHRSDDLRSPRGVFSLTDAGGRLPDPGGKLPYDRSGGFTARGTGFEGEPLAGSFDYVVAINYNRVAGTSPLDWGRPWGAKKGGGIWLHVDHGGPTQGCVSLTRRHMKDLLRALDPARNPVVVMGDAEWLGR